MKKLIFLLIGSILFTLSGQNLYACTCGIPSRQAVEALSEEQFSKFIKPFSAIFYGRVIEKQ
jgi:hypothetical protein